ncbi:MBL fold metallo-hydrolase [Carboxylicivirga sp. M1479]|uniref:MBL fold metallo-hydrolase n=1 Tax=Carboxylicivirga sp. M1479 TaxID=2594476 RepID=UPI00117806F2|nr:MBL fold metallo-hydrolase [Carboxylicivirga sp. M1479]TRX70939.1 MBL fold metallo-hydrolase [Carboxylicivirga sp. M1479]
MIKVCAIASGSNGNCYYIGTEKEAILVDAGISRRQIMKRMKELRLDISRVKAVFITHEHADHIRGLRVLCDVNGITGYLTRDTLQKAHRNYHPKSAHVFKAGESIKLGAFVIHSFKKQHDAIDPTSFRVEVNGLNVGVMTDIGEACNNLKKHLHACDIAFLESNYDEQLLEDGPYPYHLKQRVKSDKGHLSNKQAVELLEQMGTSNLHTVFLSHISADNNRVEIAMKAFEHLTDKYKILPTNRYAPSEIVTIGEEQLALFND